MENSNVTHGKITVEPIETKFADHAQDTAVALLETSKMLKINKQVDYDAAAEGLKNIKRISKEVEGERKKITEPLNKAKAAIMDLFRKPLVILGEAEEIVKKSMITYTDEQEKKRREQEEKLARQAKAEEDRKKKALEERAKKAEAEGKTEKAEELRDKKEEVRVDAPVLAPRTETPKGVSYRDKWTAEVADFAKLPDDYKLPNMAMLNKMAQATKGKVPISGVTFKSEKILASRNF